MRERESGEREREWRESERVHVCACVRAREREWRESERVHEREERVLPSLQSQQIFLKYLLVGIPAGPLRSLVNEEAPAFRRHKGKSDKKKKVKSSQARKKRIPGFPLHRKRQLRWRCSR